MEESEWAFHSAEQPSESCEEEEAGCCCCCWWDV